MTTKDIRAQVAIYTTLKKTDKFKRAVDLALAQNLPIKILVAPPFRGFVAKLTNGKKATFKVKVKNTNTGSVHFIGRCVTSNHADRKSGVYGGLHCGAGDFDTINKMLLEHRPDLDLTKVTYTHIGAHSSDDLKSLITWGDFALAISRVCKADFAHLEDCGRCSGVGIIPEFMHVYDGVCFSCCGSGKHLHTGEDAVLK